LGFSSGRKNRGPQRPVRWNDFRDRRARTLAACHPGAQLGAGGGSNHRAEATGRERRDKERDHVAVMLHLRVRYVSKAAILTVPAPLVPVKKSKSRLNSKGLDR
jgi:hypothetical protein